MVDEYDKEGNVTYIIHMRGFATTDAMLRILFANVRTGKENLVSASVYDGDTLRIKTMMQNTKT